MTSSSDLSPEWWESLLNMLIPLTVAKYSMTPKKMSTKKMWDKLKDLKLQDLGLTEPSVDKYMRTYCNSSAFSDASTSAETPQDNPPSLLRSSRQGHRRNKSSGTDLTPLNLRSSAETEPKKHLIPHIHLPFKEKDKEHNYHHKEAKSMNNILASLDNNDDEDSPLHRGSLPSPFHSSSHYSATPVPRDRSLTDSVVVVKDEEDSNIRRFRHKLNKRTEGQENDGKAREFKEVVESQYGAQESPPLQTEPSPPLRHSLSAVMATYKRSSDIIDISDALEDSPMFRQKTKLVESDIFEFGKQLKSTLKISEESCNQTVNLSDTMSKLADAFLRFREAYDPKVVQDQLLDQGLAQFAKTLEGVESLRSSLISEIKTVMYEPMSSLQQSTKELSGFAKKFEKHAAEFEAIRDKYSKNYTKKNEVELMHVKNKMRLSAMNLTFQLNEMEQRKKFQHLEGVCRFMMAHSMFIEKAHKMFQSVEPVVKEVYAVVMQKRQEFDKFQEKMKRRRITVEIAVAQLPISMENKNNKNVKAEHQGYLYKRSNHMLHPVWKKRFFVVTGGMLLEKKELNTVNCVPLLTCSAKPRADIDKRCFELVTPDKSHIMQAESEEAQVEWVSVLQNVIAQQLNSQALGSQNHQRSQALKDPIAWLKEQLTASNRDVNQFFSCADCGAEGSEWCSLNLGILTCIECSGIHRSLGVHISKVRSLQLDAWDENNLKYMLAFGNVNVNSVFEYQIPSSWTKPNPKSDRESREKYIRAKYQHKTFIDPTTIKHVNQKLFEAASKGDYMLLLKLLAQGVDLDTVDDSGRTSLHLATMNGHMIAVQFLVFNRCNLAGADRADRNALHYAADIGLNEILSFLVKNCETSEPIHHKDASDQEPMDVAISNEHTECINVLLDYFSKS